MDWVGKVIPQGIKDKSVPERGVMQRSLQAHISSWKQTPYHLVELSVAV
jgi:hypothetical protein